MTTTPKTTASQGASDASQNKGPANNPQWTHDQRNAYDTAYKGAKK